jgi:ADP-ribosylglycohydrolase
MGNGGAMRVAPLGADFADDLDELVRQAPASAEVTHAHPEGQAGAIAMTIAEVTTTTPYLAGDKARPDEVRAGRGMMSSIGEGRPGGIRPAISTRPAE